MTKNNDKKSSGSSETCSNEDKNCTSTQAGPAKDPTNVPKDLPPKAKIDVKNVILVLSGKGGVGKSTVAVNLAAALSDSGKNVGILDLDIHGPNVPKMLGIENQRPVVLAKSIQPVRISPTLAVMSMAFLLPDTSTPVVWRGPMKMGAIQQFLSEVSWGSLDYLVVDLPPGTGDEALTIAQLAPNVRGAVIVTSPQDVAVMDATKAIEFIKKLDLPVIGIIENMSGMLCPHCHEHVDIFGKGGGKKAAEQHDIPFLGEIPLDPAMVLAGDEGRPFIHVHSGSPTAQAMQDVMENLVKILEKNDS
ncbi:MAG: Mrp/NBP35 family ATP-binding protein [Methanoregula sp.]|jgi:ATP-binding protein involved in chromosome partitioning